MLMEDDKQGTKKEIIKEKKEQKKKENLDPKDAKIEELTELLQRVQADFENYKKKCVKDYDNMRKCSAANIICKILPILDSFELGFKNKGSEDFIKGMELVYSQLMSVLEGEGLAQIKSEGTKFNPYKHEVLLQEKSDKDDDIVIEELQKGFTLNGQVIRTAKVKVSKK